MRTATNIIFISIAFLFLLSSCAGESRRSSPTVHIVETDYVRIKVDTVRMEFAKSFLHGRKCGDLYYIYFSRFEDRNDRTYLRVIDRDANIRHDILVDDSWNQFPEYQKKLLDSLGCDCSNPFLYEDERFEVTSYCRGEFGGMIFFKDKMTGIVYGEGSTCAVSVNKFNGKYYITDRLGHMGNHCEIFEIEDPTMLPDTAKAGIIYRYVNRPGFDDMIHHDDTPEELYSMGRLEVISPGNNGEPYQFGYPDNTLFERYSGDEFELDFSFVHKGRFLHFYSDRENTYIGELEDGEMVQRYTWPDNIAIWYSIQYKPGYQVASFTTGYAGEHGMMEISPDTIIVRMFSNGAERIERVDIEFVDIDISTPFTVAPESFNDFFCDTKDSLTVFSRWWIKNFQRDIMDCNEISDGKPLDIRVVMTIYTDRDTTGLYAGYHTFMYRDKVYEVNNAFRATLRLLGNERKYRGKTLR